MKRAKRDVFYSSRSYIKINNLITFGFGVFTGIYLAYTVISSWECNLNYGIKIIPSDTNESSLSHEYHSYENEYNDGAFNKSAVMETREGDEIFQIGTRTVAEELYQRIRVICWIMTSPMNHERKAKHVKATWGKRCNTLLFMSTVEDESLPSIALPVQEGKKYLWGKTKEAFKYIYENYDDYDYVLKADDDTYVIVENLRYMLTSFNPDDTVYLGCRLKPHVEQGYMNGGSGYLLSRNSVKKFVEEAIPHNGCRQDDEGYEDIEIGKCLELVGIQSGDSRDSLGRGRFFPLSIGQQMFFRSRDAEFRYWKSHTYYPVNEGMDCCSDTAISFHSVSRNSMYVFEYLIYRLRPYGVSYNVDPSIVNKIDSTWEDNTTKTED